MTTFLTRLLCIRVLNKGTPVTILLPRSEVKSFTCRQAIYIVSGHAFTSSTGYSVYRESFHLEVSLPIGYCV